LGNERIEALCDAFNEDMRTVKSLSGESLRPRFSAGSGDFSIEYQKKLFEILDPPTSIGLTLNDSYLMTPLKSVTALIGVEKIKELQ
jgi:cobalamin-dependent methionine synthase I